MNVPRFIASFALAAVAPVAADAQFTTFVSPPQRVDTIVLTDTVLRTADSASTSVANMKAWVDSAAGDAIDLSAVDTTPVATPRGDVFGDGLPAPDTATPLPMILTAGVGAIAAGAFLLRRR